MSDDGWRPWPPRARWTAYEIAATWDDADDRAAFIASLSEREWDLIKAAAQDEPDAEGYSPTPLERQIAREMAASVSGRPS